MTLCAPKSLLKKFLLLFSYSIRKEKMLSLSTKERKAKFNTDDLII